MIAQLGLLLLCSCIGFGDADDELRDNSTGWPLIPLEGEATGGVLYVSDLMARNPRTFWVETAPGESAEEVAVRLVRAKNATRQHDVFYANGPAVFLNPSPVAFGGTEGGLGIPDPPHSLSAEFLRVDGKLLLRWVNADEYDKLMVMLIWGPSHNFTGRGVMGGEAELSVAVEPIGLDLDRLTAWVVGYIGNVPSNAAGVTVGKDGKVQEELFGLPFTKGVPSNWQAWQLAEAQEGIRCEQVVREENVNEERPIAPYPSILHPADKPFVLRMRSSDGTSVGGIKRKFLGLQTGVKYRLRARFSRAGKRDSHAGEGSVSLHATPSISGEGALSAKQMAGLRPLPVGAVGPNAGLIARMAVAELPAAESYLQVGTGVEDGYAADLTIPAGYDEFSVWIRVEGDIPEGGVLFDWISLEELAPQEAEGAP